MTVPRRPLTAVSFASAAVLSLSMLTAGCARTTEDRLHAADELVFKRDYAEAAKLYEAVVVEASSASDAEAEEVAAVRARALFALARVRRHYLADPEGALRAYRALADQDGGTELAFEARRDMVGLLRDRMGDLERASAELTALVEAYTHRPEIPALRLELARLAMQVGRYVAVRAQAEKILAGPADEATRREARLLLGSAHVLAEEPGEALEVFGALALENVDAPTRERVRFEIARCLEMMGRLDEALVAYDEALAVARDRSVIEMRAARVRAKLAHAKTAATKVGATSIRH